MEVGRENLFVRLGLGQMNKSLENHALQAINTPLSTNELSEFDSSAESVLKHSCFTFVRKCICISKLCLWNN